MDFLTAAKHLISIDTSPAQGTVEAVKFLKKLAESMHFQVKVVDEIVNGVAQANIYVRPNDNEQKLILQTHLDTIDPGSFSLWTKTGFNPYQASIRGDKIYGLGAADVKLDFLCKLFAMKRADWSRLSGQAILVGTFGEEEQMRGAVKAIRERSIHPTVALIGEPTDLHVVYAGKGIAHIEIVIPFPQTHFDEWGEDETTGSTQSKIFQGKAAHSSSPEDGENAIEKMFDYLERLPENLHILNVDGGITFNTIPTQAALEFDLNAQTADHKPRQLKAIFQKIKELDVLFKRHPNTEFSPPHPTINIGMIRTHPDHIKLSGAVRWSSHIAEEQYLSWMKSLESVCREEKVVFRILDVKKPFRTDVESTFAKVCFEAARKVNGNAELKTQPLSNEANVFSRFGFPCIVFGPGHRQNNTHTPEEHVALDDLKKAEDFYLEVIERVCL